MTPLAYLNGQFLPQSAARLGLHDAGFVVTVNPDDRNITTTTTSTELARWAEHHGFTDAELADVQRAAVTAAFCDDATRAKVASRVDAGWT